MGSTFISSLDDVKGWMEGGRVQKLSTISAWLLSYEYTNRHLVNDPRSMIITGYESWPPQGSRKRGRTSLFIMPALCPELVLSPLIFTEKPREVKIITALAFQIS